MSISVGVADVSPFATASTLRTIWLSTAEVVALVVCDPPISAARRAPWRTAYPAVILSEIMTLASKPPIIRNTSTGMTTAISASDWPRLPAGRGESTFISIALWLDPDVGDSRCFQRPQGGEEPGFPGVGVVDGDPDEVTGAVPHVAARRRPRRPVERRTVQRVLVDLRGIRRQVAVSVLVELVDVNLGHREELGSTDDIANRRDHLAIGIRDVAQGGGHSRALCGAIACGADTEHQERAVEHAHDQHHQHRDHQRELGHRLTA